MPTEIKHTPVAHDNGQAIQTKQVKFNGGGMPSLRKSPEGGVEATPTNLANGAPSSSPAAAPSTPPPVGAGKPEGNVGAAEPKPEGQQASQPTGEEQQKGESNAERLARFRRIEQRAREREQKLVSQQKEIEAREQKIKEAEKWVSLPERLKAGSKLEVLQELGVDFKDLLEEAITTERSSKDPRVEKLETKITEMEAHQAEVERAKRDAEVKRIEHEAKQDYFRKAGEHIQANKDDFELTHLKGPQANADFWQLSEAFYAEHGEIPDPIEIIKQLEQVYEQEVLELAQKSARLKKKLGLPDDSLAGLTPQGKAQVQAQLNGTPAELSGRRSSPTLGSRQTAPLPAPPAPSGRKETDAEKLQRLIAWGNSQLRQK